MSSVRHALSSISRWLWQAFGCILFITGASLWLVVGTGLGVEPTSDEATRGKNRLRAGDLIRITISGVPKPDQQKMAEVVYVTSHSGHVRLPHLKSGIRAAGLTPIELARRIESAYTSQKIYGAPLVAVNRATSCADMDLVTVSGRVANPGSQVLRPGMTVVEAIFERGGPEDAADLTQVRLIRKERTITLDLSLINSAGYSLRLESGDLIIVPEAKDSSKAR